MVPTPSRKSHRPEKKVEIDREEEGFDDGMVLEEEIVSSLARTPPLTQAPFYRTPAAAATRSTIRRLRELVEV